MIKTHFLKGVLSSVSDKKTTSCDVQIRIEAVEDIAENISNFVYEQKDFIDGYRIEGEISFLESVSAKDLSFTEIYNLNVWYESDPSSTTNIKVFLYNRGFSTDIRTLNLRKKFYRFVIHGKPISDSLALFPEDYTGVNVDKIYFCKCTQPNLLQDFSAIIVCKNKFEAKEILSTKLKSLNLNYLDTSWFSFTLLNSAQSQIHVL